MIVGGAADYIAFPFSSLLENWTQLDVTWTWMVSQYHFQRMVETSLSINCTIPVCSTGESLGKAFDIGKQLQGSTFFAAVTLKVSVAIFHCPISFVVHCRMLK